MLVGALLGFGLVVGMATIAFVWNRYRTTQPIRYTKLQSGQHDIEMNELLVMTPINSDGNITEEHTVAVP